MGIHGRGWIRPRELEWRFPRIGALPQYKRLEGEPYRRS